MPDMLKKYRDEVLPSLKEKLGCKNNLEVPKLEKIILSTGISAESDRDVFNEAKLQLSMITGQMPVITKARKNVANFKLRIGMPVGAMVTLRGIRMYDFLNRLVHNAMPRVRDFRGIPKTGFDGSGNFNFGIQDISVFTEIDLDKVKHTLGINITMVTSAKDDQSAYELLALLEMPFGDQD